MEVLYLWPDQPALSLLVLWLASVILFWAARQPMLQLLRSLGGSLEEAFSAAANWCGTASEELRVRARDALVASGQLELQGRLEREFQRVDERFSQRLGQYSQLHRKLDDLLVHLEDDYQRSGDAPIEVPGWTAAVETIARISPNGDPNVHKILEGVQASLRDAEKKALDAYCKDTARRHKLLGSMRGSWQEVKRLMTRMRDSVGGALETASRINNWVDDYEKTRAQSDEATRALTYSAVKLFVTSLLVLGVAIGGAFINFQLIALPMSELVPAGARLGGIPVSTVSALVIVLMEAAVGIFLMDMLGITELFPKLSRIAESRRRLILGVALGGLFMLASVESSLAILREKIVEADAALKVSLAGVQEAAVVSASTSKIPVIGQAVLGFILPWILAMVAIPLEMLLDSGRHVAGSTGAALLSVFGHASRAGAHIVKSTFRVLPNLYDIYIAIPLRIERMLRDDEDENNPFLARRRPSPDTASSISGATR